MELDLHRLELRFAVTRISDALAVQRLADSMEEHGQLVECIAAGEPADVGPVLIDGYRRVAALRRLGRDTAQVQCWGCPVAQALAQVLARAGSRAFMPLEEALLLRELIDAHGLTQRDAARQCARDVSWVQRRLMLLGALPEALLQAVRDARVSSWAATRVFVPLARANSEHAQRLLAGVQAQRLSTRELCTWFEHYQGAPHAQRQRMVEHPRLFIDSLNERERERDAKRLREGPEREVMGELGHLHALLERVRRRLEPLSTPVPAPLARACGRVHAALPDVASELRRLCHDPDRDPQQRHHASPTGHQPARDEQAAGAVA
jgi:ParB family transcriptional regulator, chromosome partitioning protein